MAKSRKNQERRRRHTADIPYDSNIRTPARQIRDLPPLIRSERPSGKILERQVRFNQDRPDDLNTPLKKRASVEKAPIHSPYPSKRVEARHEKASSVSSEEISLFELREASSTELHSNSQRKTSKRSKSQRLMPGTMEDLQAQIITLKQAAKDAAEKAYTAEILVDLYRNRWLALKTHLA